MGYRARLESSPETVQEIELAAACRLNEAMELFLARRNHTAIYVAGLSAEMYLKTACYFVGGAAPGDGTDALLAAARPHPRRYVPPFRADFEFGHGLWFWSQELMARRQRRQLRRVPNRFVQISAALYLDWCIAMRYRPGSATVDEAARFLTNVEWLANNHALLRR